MKIAIIGKGNVGKALGDGLKRAGHEIRYGHRDPKEPVREAAEWGDVVILAVPYHATMDAAKEIGSAADRKVLVDVTNALDQNWNLAVGFTTSAAEELQKLLPKSRVVKAFNTVFSQNQSTGRVGKEQLTAFIAGDDKVAKLIVMELSRDIGFEPIVVGPLKSARYLEPMAVLIIELAYNLKMGTKIGFKLVKA
jgi:predicted dinucleotide-binding enzyme